MKKRLIYLGLFALNFVLLAGIFAHPAFALVQVENPVTVNSLEEVINRLGGVVRAVVVVTLIVVLIYGGWVRLTAQDNADAVARSTKIIVSAIIGFIIIVLAPVIVELVGSLIGVRGELIDL